VAQDDKATGVFPPTLSTTLNFWELGKLRRAGAAYHAHHYELHCAKRRFPACLPSFEPALGKSRCSVGFDTPVLVKKAICHPEECRVFRHDERISWITGREWFNKSRGIRASLRTRRSLAMSICPRHPFGAFGAAHCVSLLRQVFGGQALRSPRFRDKQDET